MSEEATLREEICRVGASLHARGYVHATAGNISVRLDDGFLITPTDACLGTLDPARLARLDAQGRRRAATAPARRSRCTATSTRRRCGALRDPRIPALVALTLQGVWSADDIVPPIALLRHEGRARAADSVSAPGRCRSGRSGGATHRRRALGWRGQSAR